MDINNKTSLIKLSSFYLFCLRKKWNSGIYDTAPSYSPVAKYENVKKPVTVKITIRKSAKINFNM